MQNELLYDDLLQIEQKYYSLCSQLAGAEEAKKIEKINLDKLQQLLEIGLTKSIKLAHDYSAKAIYYEYDLDNEWSSHFFICTNYHPLLEQDDDWACDWVEELKGPDIVEFAHIYSENGFDKTEKAVGITLYLVARTVVVFAKASRKVKSKIPICIAFHDQDPIMRIIE